LGGAEAGDQGRVGLVGLGAHQFTLAEGLDLGGVTTLMRTPWVCRNNAWASPFVPLASRQACSDGERELIYSPGCAAWQRLC
jgi:hypothetical protein